MEPSSETERSFFQKLVDLVHKHQVQFAFMSDPGPMRQVLVRARTAVAWDEAWNGMDPAAQVDAVCAKWAVVFGVASDWEAYRSRVVAHAVRNDQAWAATVAWGVPIKLAGVAHAPQMPGPGYRPRRETIDLDIKVTSKVAKRTTAIYDRTYDGYVDVDKATVLEFFRDDDEDGLEIYIRDQIEEQYCDMDYEDDYAHCDNDDDETTDEYDTDYPEASHYVEFLRSALEDEIAAMAEEEEEEEDDE